MTKEWIPRIKPGQEPLYLAIARALARDVTSGRLQADDELPTQRDLAETLEVSLGTVTRAYAEAEKRGLIRAEGRRGTFVGQGDSRSSALDSLIDPGPGHIDLGINYPSYNQDPDLAPALKALAQRSDLGQLLRYPHPQGLERHRRAGAAWIRRLGGEAAPESVVVTAGGQNGLFLVLSALAREGDLLLAEELTYPGVKAVAQSLGLRLMGLAIDREGLLPEALEAVCQKHQVRALYCIPDLQNPTSGVLSGERRREIAALAERHGFHIIEDAIHRPFLTEPPPLIAGLAPERTFLLASTSKTVAAGLRVGFVSGPPSETGSLVRAAQSVNLMVSPLTVEILVHWLENGTVEQVIRAKREEIRIRQEMVEEHLGRYRPLGHPSSYFAWLTLPPGIKGSDLALAAYRRGVVINPAQAFAVDESKAPEAIRLCPATPFERSTARRGLEILAELLREGEKEVFGTI